MMLMNDGKLTESADGIEIMAAEKTDFFVDTMNGVKKSDAPFVFEEMKGDFVINACVEPSFTDNYDAGGLFILEHDTRWIKLEFEKTDLGYPSVVSVITDGASDDANGEKMEGIEKVFLQVVRRSDYWALHYSLDGKAWKMVRYFRLKMSETLRIGFVAQSPLGKGTKARFTHIYIGRKQIENLRKGS
ncbi:MAG TPA: DUF1349 domain-containing protein [Rectinemataceae bacterium]|nr:DUF1349 domain-containing protein [Rectinemataceae bacterium]